MSDDPYQTKLAIAFSVGILFVGGCWLVWNFVVPAVEAALN